MTKVESAKANLEKCHIHKEEAVFMRKEELHRFLIRAIKYIMNQGQVTTEVVQHKFYK